MRQVMLATALLAALACAKHEAARSAKPLSEAGEKTYVVRGVVVGRDAADNTVKLDHEQIPGYMEAMTMDYPVRGAAVASLPADHSRITATLHVHDENVWLTDVKTVSR